MKCFRSAWLDGPSSGPHIIDVFLLSPLTKVFLAKARWSVAGMKNIQRFIQKSMNKQEGNPRHKPLFSVPIDFAIPARPQVVWPNQALFRVPVRFQHLAKDVGLTNVSELVKFVGGHVSSPLTGVSVDRGAKTLRSFSVYHSFDSPHSTTGRHPSRPVFFRKDI